MKYNPRINEVAARLFSHLHPLQPHTTSQGILSLLTALSRKLLAVTGMDGVSLAPAAGAHGGLRRHHCISIPFVAELTGLMMVRQALLREDGISGSRRRVVLVPASAHGTNFSSASQAGFRGSFEICAKDALIIVRASAHSRTASQR